jgi:hypothetical protein
MKLFSDVLSLGLCESSSLGLRKAIANAGCTTIAYLTNFGFLTSVDTNDRRPHLLDIAAGKDAAF